MKFYEKMLVILFFILIKQNSFAFEKSKNSAESSKVPKTIKEVLLDMSKEANKKNPLKIDIYTTLAETRVEGELNFIYSYIVKWDSEQFKRTLEFLQDKSANELCKNQFMGELITKHKVNFIFEYKNSKKEKVGAFFIDAVNCNLPLTPVVFRVNKGCVNGVFSVISKSKHLNLLSDEKKNNYSDKCSEKVTSSISQQSSGEMNQMLLDPRGYGCGLGVGLMLSEILSKDDHEKVFKDAKLLNDLLKLYCSDL